MKVDDPEKKGVDGFVWLSEVKTMTNKALEESDMKKDSHVNKIAEMKVINALEICAVEGQHGVARSIASLALRSIVGDVLDKRVVAGKIQKTNMKSLIHHVTIQQITGTLLQENRLKSTIATFI